MTEPDMENCSSNPLPLLKSLYKVTHCIFLPVPGHSTDQYKRQVPSIQSYLACFSAICLSSQPLFFSCASNCCRFGSLLSAPPTVRSFCPASYPVIGSFRLIDRKSTRLNSSHLGI